MKKLLPTSGSNLITPTPDKVAARLRAMCDQVGHPDYSLAEFVRGVREAADDLPPPAGMVTYPAIHLVKVSPRHWEVRIEVGKEWVTVIEEVDGDGGNSHIVEPSGIYARIQAALSARERKE